MHSFRYSLTAALWRVLPLLFLASALDAAPVFDWPQLQFTQVVAGLSFPTDIARDGSGRLFISEQRGRVVLLQTNGDSSQVFLDIRDRVYFVPGGEDGLLGTAFPPDYASSGAFYVYYNDFEERLATLSRFHVSTNANAADPATEEILLQIPPRGPYLNGGQLAFGPDGYLYLAVGDSGFSPTVGSFAQDAGSLRGKILRLDVSGLTNGYAIPASNPFIGQPGYLPEIWALGFRNPFRFSFDRLTGDFFVSDVGQNTWEEIDYKPAALPGGQNYGWPIKEGNHDNAQALGVDPATFTGPIAEYGHTANTAAVGGYIYRGPSSPRLDGTYFFGDFGSGQIWGVKRNGVAWSTQLIGQAPFLISTFGEDASGRLYVANYVGGKVYRIEDNGQAAPVTFSPAAGVIANDTVVLSSITPGVTIHYSTDGSVPTAASPAVASGGTVVVSNGMTIRAQVFRGDLLPSAETNAAFFLRAGAPAYTPGQGPITNGTMVTLQSATVGATIRYTLDGTGPGTGSPVYGVPLSINSNTVLQARAFKAGFDESLVTTFAQTPFRVTNTVISTLYDNIVISWEPVKGKVYQVQFSDDFSNWFNVGKTLIPNAVPLSFTNFAQYPLPFRRYFRVRGTDL